MTFYIRVGVTPDIALHDLSFRSDPWPKQETTKNLHHQFYHALLDSYLEF